MILARIFKLFPLQYSGLLNTDSAESDFQFDVDGSDPGNYRHRGAVNTILGSVSSEWIHLAASCDGLQTSVYYNGLQVAVTATADTQLGQIGMGGNRGFTEHFAGVIDDVRVYDRALSAAEVAGLSGMTQPFSRLFWNRLEPRMRGNSLLGGAGYVDLYDAFAHARCP